MKKIEAIVRPERVGLVRKALEGRLAPANGDCDPARWPHWPEGVPDAVLEDYVRREGGLPPGTPLLDSVLENLAECGA